VIFIEKGSMEFNIKKYDRMTFHKDEVVNKRIIALFLWFDYEVIKKKLTLKQQVKLIDYWVGELTRMEYYEIIPFFNNRRKQLVGKITKKKDMEDK
jgi:hypothetical protein